MIEHKKQAVGRLATQFRESPNLIKYIETLLIEADTLESVYNDLLTDRWVDTAEGVQLDVIGIIVGLARFPGNGGDLIDDDLYRLFLKARIIANITQSTPADIIHLFQFMFDIPMIFVDGILFYEINFGRELLEIERFVIENEDIIPRTIGVIASYVSYYDPEDFFSFVGIPNGEGFGDLNDDSVGGSLNRLIVIGK